MNIEELRNLIREEVHRLLEDNTGDTFGSLPSYRDSDEPTLSLKDKLMQSPGAPFGGNLYQATGPVISNEARDYLHKWMRAAKAAWGKFGSPDNWPKEITELCVKLGQAFEQKMGSKGPTQYR